MEYLRFSVYGFESKDLPDDLKLVAKVRDAFSRLPHSVDTWFGFSSSMEEAAKQLDDFKANTCGSVVNVGLINLNSFPSLVELQFLLSPNVLGDPPTIFLSSLRSAQGEPYQFARGKAEKEAEKIQATREFATPSSIDSYSSNNRDETAVRVAELLNAYVEDDVKREEARQRGLLLPPTITPGMEALRRYQTVYYGLRRGKTVIRANPGGTGHVPSVTLR